MQNNFSHLIPDYDDLREDILASFPSIRSKTLETLYSSQHYDENDNDVSSSGLPRRMDKSPKGSVDEAIQELVNLINAHPSFSTLSSCSGRIALFDPLLERTGASTLTNTTVQSHEQQQERPDSSNNDDDENDIGNGDTRPAVARSGKGGTGGWLLASHEVVEPTILVDLLQKSNNDHHHDVSSSDDDDGNALSFKMEPLLLHVAAANLTRGRQLLQIALQAAGLRESGLVVTESRVTVALRGQSLALCVPLARCKDLRPNDEYLVALVDQANRRLQRNFEKISRLFEAVQCQIFRPPPNNNKSLKAPAPAATCQIRASPLPALNLWRHASVIVPSRSRHFSSHAHEPKSEQADNDDDHSQQEEEMELLVFGGYGSGPIILDNNGNEQDEADVNNTTTASTTARRSDKVYRLRRNLKGSWSEAWEQVIVMSTNNNSENNLGSNQETAGSSSSTGTVAKQNCLGLKVRNVAFTAREGLAACLLSCSSVASSSSSSSCSSKDIIAIFGGRQGPNRPLNDLLFFDNAENDNGSIRHQSSFQAPIDVRGTPPTPRWGHSFTAISLPESNDDINNGRRGSLEQRPLALVVGGCTDSRTFASVHVLSIIVVGVEENEMNEQESSDSHLVWTEVMESAASGYCRPRFYHAATAMSSHNQTIVFGGLWNAQNLLGVAEHNEQQDDATGLVVDTTNIIFSGGGSIEPLPCTTPFDNLFGHSVSLLPGAQSTSGGTTYLSIGGIPRVAHDEDDGDHNAYLPIRCVTLKTPTAPPPSDSTTASCCNQIMDKKDKQQKQKPKDSSWIVQEHSVEFVDDNDDSNNNNNNNEPRRPIAINLGCLVHHSCNVARTRNRNEFQLLVVGGGVQGFAFGPIFGMSHLLTVNLSPNAKPSSSRGNPGDYCSLIEERATGHDVKGRNGDTFIQHEIEQHYSARERMKTPTASKNGDSNNEQQQQRETNVLYVTKQDAKTVKTLLEEAHLLDKEYRMGPAADVATHLMTAETTTTTTLLIAVPVTPDCLDLLRENGPLADALRPQIQGSGKQPMSFSSSVFAARARKKNAPK